MQDVAENAEKHYIRSLCKALCDTGGTQWQKMVKRWSKIQKKILFDVGVENIAKIHFL